MEEWCTVSREEDETAPPAKSPPPPHFKLSCMSAITVSAGYNGGAVGENLQIKHEAVLLVLPKHFFSAARYSWLGRNCEAGKMEVLAAGGGLWPHRDPPFSRCFHKGQSEASFTQKHLLSR